MNIKAQNAQNLCGGKAKEVDEADHIEAGKNPKCITPPGNGNIRGMCDGKTLIRELINWNEKIKIGCTYADWKKVVGRNKQMGSSLLRIVVQN